MKILGIETSADDTGIALIEADGDLPRVAGGKAGFGPQFTFKVLANEIASQTHAHILYGGIYPNVAKREHSQNLAPLLEKVLKQSGITTDKPNVDVIAVTVGPGLEPCLWTGITFAQKLSKTWNVPIVPVNHMEGHITISMMEMMNIKHPNILKNVGMSGTLAKFEFPAIVLLISGGHTELILMKNFRQYEYIGRTRDDAVGEAFDKVARLLDLPYPGGPEISRLAGFARSQKLKADFSLPRPMMHENSYEFSFSGLKTAVERHVKAHTLQSLDREKIAREFEDAVTEVLLWKTLRAVEEYGANAVIMGGGVSANKHIREELRSKLRASSCELLVCPPEFSTDNGLMIALAGYFHALKKEFADPNTLKAVGSLPLPIVSKQS